MDDELDRAVGSRTSRRHWTGGRRGTLALILPFLVGPTGCGGVALARLDRGTFARAESGTAEPVLVFFHKGEEVVPRGTPVQIVSDAEGAVGDTDRKVLATFRSGPHEGIVGMIRRRDLQPDPH